MAEFSYRKEIFAVLPQNSMGQSQHILWAKYPRYAALRHNDEKNGTH